MVVFGQAVRDVGTAKTESAGANRNSESCNFTTMWQASAAGAAADAAAPPSARTGLLITNHNNVGVTLWENVLTGRGHVVY